jgi:DNA-binding IscR family transcriptional regulator
MELPHSAIYGILLLQELRKNPKPLTKFQLSDRVGIEPVYVQQLLIPLLAAGLVASERGCYGGYKLADRTHQATVWEIAEAESRAQEHPHSGRFGKVSAQISAHLKNALSKLRADRL